MKKVPLQRTQSYIIWLGLLPLLLSFVAYRISSEHVASVEATLATDEFIRKLDELLSTIQDAETGQRGYLLTGEARYRTPYDEAVAALPKRLSDVAALAARNGVPHDEVARLRDLVNDKMRELQKTLDLRSRADMRAALAEVETDRGQLYMMQIRGAIGRIKNQQTATFGERLAKQQRSQRMLDAVLGVGIGLGFLLLCLAYRFNVLYARDRDQIEAEIRAVNNSLESRVKERTAELEARTRELERRSVELQRSNADLTQFAYVASHDLQEPLRMVGSYMGLLARRYEGKLDATADRYIHFAIDGANRMQALIQDLLTYSRAGTQSLDKRPVSSEQVLRAALTNLDLAIKESSAIIRYADLPVVEADETKLLQVLQNLIGNAVKFRKPDIAPEISVTAQRSNGDWLFSVADNGIGFDPRYCDRIFQVFQRLHGVGKYPGNGIGLAICRRIIEHHGGKLWAESQPDIGSTFFFTIPAATNIHREQSHVTQSKGVPEVIPHV